MIDSERCKEKEFFSVDDLGGSTMLGPWQALVHLQGLSSLSVSLRSDIELIALLSAAQAAPMSNSLTCLELYLTADTSVSLCGLMHIARLRGLHQLSVVFSGYTWNLSGDQAFLLLCAVWGVGRVCIYPNSDAQLQAFQAGKVKLGQSGLPFAGELVLYKPDT
jgi:hypothetical protein